ncbi:MAG: RpiB/LacA/LacB family sugar-phosphate isomerase [Actinobacteria bacterium]|nr:RpiB/LacA/LacB family sugar-phosphate isomerase [Actinomycetota bacterium]
MRIAIGSDHAGFALKSLVAKHLADAGHEVIDHGTDSEEQVDYPPPREALAADRRHRERGVWEVTPTAGGSR